MFPLAHINPDAELANGVTVGPFSVVEEGVKIDRGCQLGSHVIVKKGTEIGADNIIDDGAILGGIPQHVQATGEVGRLVIGSGNRIRENVTIHRSMRPENTTCIGNDNFLMVGCHIGHDCHLGNRIIMANNVLLAGHVTVFDAAYISGAVAVHQFCRIGAHAMISGLARIRQDVPPYVTVDGGSDRVVGLNSIGLRRSGFGRKEMARLKSAYRIIFHDNLCWRDMMKTLRDKFPDEPAAEFYRFLSQSRRGIMVSRSLPRHATLRLVTDLDEFAADKDLPAREVRRAG